MAVKLKTPISEVDRLISQTNQYAERKTVRVLGFLGEKCIIEARDRSQQESWYDQTGNLRSSIGYVIVVNGKIVSTNGFGKVKNGSNGVLEGKALARKLAGNYKTGYALIVVAGMHYAAYVEAMDNKVVLTSAALLARRELPGMMRQLKTQIAT